MPSTTLSLSRCSTCGKEYKNSKGLTQHKYYVQQYNQRQQELDELPINTINEFKQIIVTEIHRKLTPSFRSMGKKTLTILCTESSNSYEILSSIFNSEQWGKKIYSQNQVTYIVCADPIS
ncbi:hypothetical protein Glove_627g47 [Diversispora epigaea]|uniref:C2H2-type domain-containing protein n=1 Tax=Diversispora epigaea TaxID=1348612 RepID=A0A397G8H4_9GLOM|nr:hypothetical protein Glove_627g47 [Diversispora epigaea]